MAAGNPTSILAIQRSLLSVNLHIGSMDTTQCWFPAPPLYTGRGNRLGATRDQLFQQRCGSGTNGDRDGATQGDGGGQEGSLKRQDYDVQMRNQNMYPLLDTLMKPILD